MAFTAIHPELGRLDTSLPGLGRGLEWPQVHGRKVGLTCADCGHGMHAEPQREVQRVSFRLKRETL